MIKSPRIASSVGLMAMLVSFLIACHSPLAAQEKKEGKSAKLEIRLSCVKRLPQPTYYLMAEGMESPLPCDVSSWQLSQSLTLPVAAPVFIYPVLEDAAAMLREKALAYFIPAAGGGEFIGILIGKSETEKPSKPVDQLPYRCQLINADAAHFKGGSKLVFNLSTFPVAINFAGQKVELKPNTVKFLKSASDAKGDFLLVQGMFRAKENDQWRTFLTSRWLSDSKNRSLVFIYNGRADRFPMFHAIEDNKGRE